MALKRRLAATALILAAAGLAGCASDAAQHAGDHAAIMRDPSPAMSTLAQRTSDRYNRRTVSWDTDMRMTHDDAARLIFYTDQPSRLTPATKPY